MACAPSNSTGRPASSASCTRCTVSSIIGSRRGTIARYCSQISSASSGQAVVDLGQHAVLLAQREVELLAEDLGVEQVLHAQADAQRLVGVGGADAALGGAELVLAQEALGDAVELLVVRHDQVRVARELHARRVDALALEHVELVDEHRGVDHHAVADDGGDVRIEHAARHQLQREHLVADDDAVSRVVTTLVANDEVALLRQVVGEAALAFVTPLGADDHRARHTSPRATQPVQVSR